MKPMAWKIATYPNVKPATRSFSTRGAVNGLSLPLSPAGSSTAHRTTARLKRKWTKALAIAHPQVRQLVRLANPILQLTKPLTVPAARLLLVFRKLFQHAETRPLTVGALVSGILGLGADAVSQNMYGNAFDLKRNFMFGMHGVLYIGVFQYFLWCRLFTSFTGAVCSTSATATTLMVGMDLFLHIPFIYFPVFYVMKEGMTSQRLDKKGLQAAYASWRANIKDDVKACWGMWAPIQCLTFSVIPMHLRVSFVSCINFVWTVILSTSRGGE